MSIYETVKEKIFLERSKELFNYLKKNGGFTAKPNLIPVKPKSGYAVSLKGYETRVPLEIVSLGLFRELLKCYQRLAEKNIAYIGGWIDEGYLYLDLSLILHNKEQALEVASKNKQKAIFDFGSGKTIYLEVKE